MEWCFYAELYDPIQARPAGAHAGAAAELKFRDEKLAGAVDPKTAGLLVIDAFGEGKADLLAWSRDGIRLYRNGRQAIEQTGLEALKGVIAVAAGDFDNDGLPDLCVLTETGPALYRNTKGRFETRDASLPAGRFEAAVWLDFDHDYDLDLFLLGAPVGAAAQRERRRSAITPRTSRLSPVTRSPPQPFRVVPDTKAMDLAVAYADHKGVLYRDRLRGVFQASPLDAVPAGAAGAARGGHRQRRLDRPRVHLAHGRVAGAQPQRKVRAAGAGGARGCHRFR